MVNNKTSDGIGCSTQMSGWTSHNLSEEVILISIFLLQPPLVYFLVAFRDKLVWNLCFYWTNCVRTSGVLIAGVLICGSLAGNKWNKPITHMYERIFHFHGCISANESSLTDFTSLWQLFDAFLLRHSLLVHLAPDMTTTGLITYFIFTGFLTWNSLEVTLEFKPNSPLSLLAFQY